MGRSFGSKGVVCVSVLQQDVCGNKRPSPAIVASLIKVSLILGLFCKVKKKELPVWRPFPSVCDLVWVTNISQIFINLRTSWPKVVWLAWVVWKWVPLTVLLPLGCKWISARNFRISWLTGLQFIMTDLHILCWVVTIFVKNPPRTERCYVGPRSVYICRWSCWTARVPCQSTDGRPHFSCGNRRRLMEACTMKLQDSWEVKNVCVCVCVLRRGVYVPFVVLFDVVLQCCNISRDSRCVLGLV